MKVIHPNLTFIEKDFHSFHFQKYLRLVLDSKLKKKKNSIVNNGKRLY